MLPTQAAGGGSLSKTRILVVDDHPLVREWLAHLINREPDLAVCGDAVDAPQTLAAIAALEPDLVILDLLMKGAHGTELLKQIHTNWGKLPVLVLSTHDEALYAERVIRAGARGYISKQEAGDKIKLAIRRILAGGIYTSEQVAASLLSKSLDQSAAAQLSPLDSLSDRELELFRLIGRGHGPSQIATELHLSIKTVEGYTARLKIKLGAKTAGELQRYAIEWHRSHGP